MSSTNRCRLCLKMCQERKSLYDENCSGNSLYDITMNYFHPKIININLAKHLTGICLECWQHISNFQSFQTSVMLAQKYLDISDEFVLTNDDDDDIKRLNSTEIVVKSEAVESEEENSVHSMEVSQTCENSTTNDSEQIALPTLEIMDVKCDNSNDESMPSQSEFISDTEEEGEESPSANKTDNLEVASNNQDILNLEKFVKELNRKYAAVDMDELIAKHKPIIECDQCSETFKMFSSFNDHFVDQHPNVDSYFTCFCSAKKWKMVDGMIMKGHIKDHFLMHGDPDVFKCLICGSNRYKFKCNLHRHIMSQHGDGRKLVCIICDRCFSTKKGLAKHKTTVHKKNRDNSMPAIMTITGTKYACNECDKVFLSHKSIRRHIDSIHGNIAGKGFKCEVCQKTFKQPRTLREHATRHTMQDLYACAFCAEKFKRMSRVIIHRNKVHPLEQDKTFFHHINNQDLNVNNEDINVAEFLKGLYQKYRDFDMDELIAKHMPTISCDQCSKTFKTFSSFNEHCAKQHPNIDLYFTCFCSAKKWTIYDSRFLRGHIKDHFLIHDDPDFFKCLICGSNRYNNKRSLQRHVTLQHGDTVHTDNRNNSTQANSKKTGTKFGCDKSMKRNIDGQTKFQPALPELEIMDIKCDDSMSSQSEFISNVGEDDVASL